MNFWFIKLSVMFHCLDFFLNHLVCFFYKLQIYTDNNTEMACRVTAFIQSLFKVFDTTNIRVFHKLWILQSD